MSTVLVATFKSNKEAKRVAEKHGAKSFQKQVVLDVKPLETDGMKNLFSSLRQAGAKRIYLPSSCQELIVTVLLPKNASLKTLPLTNSPELVETVKLLITFCGKPEIKVGRKITKWVFRYAGMKIYRRTHNRSRGQFCFYSPRDRTVTGVPKQKEVKVKIVKDLK